MFRLQVTKVSAASLVLSTALILGMCSCSTTPTESAEGGGPLSEYMSALWDAESYTQERLDAELQKTEELISVCMAEQGFTYTPSSVNGGAVVLTSDDDGVRWGSAEFAQQYGYGIVDSPGMSEPIDESTEPAPDPNEDYVAALSESERNAYHEALWGEASLEEEVGESSVDGAPVEYDWKKEGCQGSAQHEVQQESSPIDAAREDPAFVDLFAEMEAFFAEHYSGENPTPKTIALNEKWYDCMVKSGFTDYQSPALAMQQMFEEYDQLQASSGPEGEQRALGDTEQQKFSEHEIAVAVSDSECRTTLNYDELANQEIVKLEQDFVDKHRTELDALVAAHGITETK